MVRRSTALWLMLATCAGITLFLVKHEVQEREDRLNALHSEILDNQEAIQVLKAEWSYLNRPERLERLIREFSEERPADRLQRATLDMLPQPLNSDGEAPLTEAAHIGGIVLPMARPVTVGAPQ
ncbi:cell division protein FtsL [Nisaea sediminum]|uniref:cell division protein FtsL n=1 Tax=Nisaea sediminum TaxID=2775867 RepID=UPI00186674CC|nr:hypothetical protein [Nisaea sediminum]